jgi:hypothetical protein
MIPNGKDVNILQSTQLLDVAPAVMSNLQNVIIQIVTRANVNYRVVKTPGTPVQTLASKVPYKPQETEILEEGWRAWKWFKLAIINDIGLGIGDIFTLNGTNTKIMSIYDAREYGLLGYVVCQDYTQ